MSNARRLTLVAVLFLSCAAPYFERAAIEKGFSGALGAGPRFGLWPSSLGFPSEMPEFGLQASAFGTLVLRYGFSDRLAAFAQASGGPGWWLTGGRRPGLRPPEEMAFDFQLGVKLGLGRSGALRVSTGVPGLLDVIYLHDYGSRWTGVYGLGLRGAVFGLSHHVVLPRRLAGCTSLVITPSYNLNSVGIAAIIPGCHLGFAVGFPRRP